jgi:hypothetical protein
MDLVISSPEGCVTSFHRPFAPAWKEKRHVLALPPRPHQSGWEFFGCTRSGPDGIVGKRLSVCGVRRALRCALRSCADALTQLVPCQAHF